MKKDYYELYNDIIRKYPIHIALVSIILSIASFSAEFKDSFIFLEQGYWGLTLVAILITIFSTLSGFYLSKCLFKFIEQLSNKPLAENFLISESSDTFEFPDTNLTLCKFSRTQKVNILKSNNITAIYYREPRTTSAKLNMKCYHLENGNYTEKQIQHFESPRGKYLKYDCLQNHGNELTLKWTWDLQNSFLQKDSVSISPHPNQVSCIVNLIFPATLQISKIFAFYGYQNQVFPNEIPLRMPAITSNNMTFSYDFKDLIPQSYTVFGIAWEI